MERLTSREPRSSGLPGVSCAHFRGGDCEAVQGRCSDGCPWEESAWERLAAYEDTGLKPEDIDALQKREQGLAEMLVNVSCGCAVPYTRLAELAQAEKDGRLVVLPAENKELTDTEVAEMTGYKCLICVYHSLCTMPGMRPLCGEYYDHFASKAEAALKKREADNEHEH